MQIDKILKRVNTQNFTLSISDAAGHNDDGSHTADARRQNRGRRSHHVRFSRHI